MNTKPYIGITGPITIQEAKRITEEFADAGYTMQSSHVPMLGFLVSEKTLHGQPTKNRRYPPINSLSALLKSTSGKVLNMIHYNSRQRDELATQVAQIFREIYEVGLCRALQLNIVWPDISQVQRIKEEHPEIKIVFQASHKSIDGNTPTQLARKIGNYGNSIDYILIDPSGGRGMSFDLATVSPIYRELRSKLPEINLGFAGGFTGQNVGPRVREIIEEIREETFCIDAEGGLRDKITDNYGDDTLNIEKVRMYVQETSTVLR